MTSRGWVIGIGLSIVGGGCDAPQSAADAGRDAVASLVDAPGVDAVMVASDAGGEDAPSSDDAARAEQDAARPGGTAYAAPVALGDLSGVPETSGIVASRTHTGIFWVHNDSGNPEEIYAIDETAGIVATFAITGATNQDWEDITLLVRAGTDAIYVGDHGDNLARTSDGADSSRPGYVRLYRIDEPDPSAGDASVAATEIRLAYPDGPHDCEGMFTDSSTGDVYLFSKVDSGTAALYVARAPLGEPGPTMMERVADIAMASITAADLSDDGARLAVRNYAQIRVFDVAGTIPAALAGTPLRPGFASPAEAIAFGAGSWDLYTIAEGDGATLYRIAWE